MRDLEVNSSDIVNYPIFIGHTGICNLRLGVGKDADNLYITCKVKDGELYSGGQGTQKGSGVFIYLDTKNECLKEPAEGVYKVWCSYKGDITVWQGNKGNGRIVSWKDYKSLLLLCREVMNLLLPFL